jgi:dinuclear metal center YbgI/SA1388 family protein
MAGDPTIAIMAVVAEVLAALSRLAPVDKAAAWDASGLQLGDPNSEAQRIGVCHEITEPVAARALEEGLDLLITYHPLLFRPTNRLVAGNSAAGRAFGLIRGGVAVAVAHTSWDAAAGGTADALASRLGLTEVGRWGPLAGSEQIKVVTFVPKDSVSLVAEAMSAAGAGTIGNYTGCSFRSEGLGSFFAGEGASPAVGKREETHLEDEIRLEMLASKRIEPQVLAALVNSHPYEEPAVDVYEVRSGQGLIGRVGRIERPATLDELSRMVGETLASKQVRMAGRRDREISSVAVLPGSGGSFVSMAVTTGADVLVTGDVDHHQAREAIDLGLAVIDAGHAATERPGVRRLYEAVSGITAGVVDLASDPTPWISP